MANKKRLIDANTAHEELSSLAVMVTGLRAGKGILYEYMKQYRESVLRVIDEQPTVDAVEVVHGRWVEGYPIHCSVCGGAAPTDYEDCNRYEAWLTPYCPNCGAKMDGDGNG